MPPHSGFGGMPAPPSLVACFELDVEVAGSPSPQTGYLIGIQDLDAAVRQVAMPHLETAFSNRDGDLATVLMRITRDLSESLPVSVAKIGLAVTPFHVLECRLCTSHPTATSGSRAMSPPPPPSEHLLLRQRFEFAASHRLHCPDLDEAANRAAFGKCNNPNGHGHNYRLETCVEVPVGGNPPRCDFAAVEQVVGRTVIERFDHRHLNLDVPEFRTLNPSVEHIAAVSYRLLVDPIASCGGTLRSVTVWETDRTCCTYPA